MTPLDPSAGAAAAVDVPIDVDYLRRTMLELLRVPSPSGRTDAVIQVVGDMITELGVPFDLTRRGLLRATLASRSKRGRQTVRRAVVVHADTIGCMVKRIQDNGRLNIRTSSPDNDTIRVEIEDNGSGIPAEAQPHVFSPRFTTRSGRVEFGLGLGLP